MGMPRILAIRKPAVRVGIGQCFPEAAVCELRIPPPTSSSTLARIFITANLGASWSASLPTRSEEHTSELQSHVNLVCRLLLEKKKKNSTNSTTQSNHHKADI